MDIPVVCCFDNRYVIPAAVALYSLMEQANAAYCYKIYVLHNDITDANARKLTTEIQKFSNASLEFIEMHNRFDDLFDNTSTKGHYSKEMYYKFIVSSLLPQYDKVIVTDVDVVFLGDVSVDYCTFNISDDYYFAGIKGLKKRGTWLENISDAYKKDFSCDERELLGYAGGYYIFNCKKIREDGLEDKFIKFAMDNVHRLLQPEQDTINICCGNKKKELHPRALVCTYLYDMYKSEDDYQEDAHYAADIVKYSLDNPIQLHYACSEKPWNSVCLKQDVWFEYLLKTDFFYDLLMKLFPKRKYTIFDKILFGHKYLFTRQRL